MECREGAGERNLEEEWWFERVMAKKGKTIQPPTHRQLRRREGNGGRGWRPSGKPSISRLKGGCRD